MSEREKHTPQPRPQQPPAPRPQQPPSPVRGPQPLHAPPNNPSPGKDRGIGRPPAPSK